MEEATVLLVDDEPQILAALRTSLRRAPFHVLTATSGGAALALLAQHRITVLVADHDMPGMSGVELLAAAARAQPGIAGIMLTGQARLEVAIGAINSGEVFRFFTKPVERDVLQAGILAAIGQARATAAGKQQLRLEQEHGRAIDELEQANPGITQVETTRTGAVVVSAPTEDLATLLAAAAAATRRPRDGGPR